MDLITKQYDADVEINDGKREVLAIISTDSVDRDNEVVIPKGLKRKNYAGNPVVMVNHDYRSLPIGKALWVKPDGNRVLSKYFVSDKTQLGRDVFGLIQDGVLRAHSVGFQSLKQSSPTSAEIKGRPELATVKTIHREWEMFEFSVVGIPANPDALTLAVSKGYSQETIDLITGKAAAIEQATTEVVRAVADNFQEKAPSKKEMIGALEKQLSERLSSFDFDKAISKAFDRLKGRTL